MPDSGHPSLRHEAPPPGAVVPPSHRATPAHQSVRCGVGGGSPRPQPPAPKENGQPAPAECSKGGLLGEGECPTPDVPH